jgi:formate hydrogenlyase transcriptional activator
MRGKVSSFECKVEPETPIIGETAGLRSVCDAVRLVAPTDTTVLIRGETGTGKELIARALHEQSARNRAPYVKVNCAAIPSGLLESELFGHDRGAFTGALAQTTGRFQLAHRGTIFLDEIGDLPLELQPKLLRVLQEQEFERLGSARTIRVNVRIVAATNLDLTEMVRERRFRADLFYRLNVFPISLPPLRERSEDIPELVWHFVQTFAARMSKEIDVISEDVMKMIRSHNWPGNIRELQNFVERAVIMSPGTVLRPPIGDLKLLAQDRAPGADRTLAQAERDHILEVLRRVDWVVGGRDGAAARLGLKRTTLLYRMHKLGIKHALAARQHSRRGIRGARNRHQE